MLDENGVNPDFVKQYAWQLAKRLNPATIQAVIKELRDNYPDAFITKMLKPEESGGDGDADADDGGIGQDNPAHPDS